MTLRSTPLTGSRIGSMCSGYGGLDLAVAQVYGARTAWCADNDPHIAQILRTRFPGVANLGDLTSIDWDAAARVDIVTAGFPCQDISYAGRGAGMRKDTRSGLWFAVADAVRQLRPGLVFVENVAALRGRGLGRVLGDLAALGYDTAWTCLRASDVGAPHRRERIFILAADPDRPRLPVPGGSGGQEGGWPCGEPAGCGVSPPAAHAGGQQPQRRREPAFLAATPDRAKSAAVAVAGHRHQDRHDLAHRGPQRADVRRSTAARDSGARRIDWGPYAPAVRRWESILGRPVPDPTETGTRGQPRIAARFVEWLMGLPGGWVTDIDVPRTAHMRALGNGVVPQQAAAALTLLHKQLREADGERPCQ